MSDASKRIWAWANGGDSEYQDRRWDDDRCEHPSVLEYILAAEHDRIVAEARNKALEDAAMCCEAEADKCDDAVKWNGPGRYARDCKAAAYAMRDRAAAIRAMKG